MTNRSSEIRVLHVDDDSEFSALTMDVLERQHDRIIVETAGSGSEAIERLANRNFDCVVSDYEMPGQNGIQLLNNVRDEYSDLPFILYTGKGSEEVASEAISAGVTDYLQKGTGTSQYEVLANRIQNAVEQQRAREEAAETEHELRQEKAFTTAALEGVVDFYWAIDLDGYVTRWSDTDGSVTGYTVEEAIGLHTSTFHPDDHFQRIAEAIKAIKTEGHAQVEADLLRKDGERRHYAFTGIALTDETGEIYSMCGTGRDITERKRQEARLEAEKERFRTLFDQLTLPAVEVEYRDTEPIVQEVNAAFEEDFGYDQKTLVGESLDGYIVPDDRTEEAQDINQRVREGGRLASEEVTRLTADGPREFLLQNAVYEDGSGGFAVYMDITERKQREQKLQEKTRRNERFRTLIDQTSDIIFVVDEAGDISYINSAVEEVLGYVPEDLMGRSGFDLIYSDDLERARDEFAKTIEVPNYIGIVEFRAEHADGSTVAIEVRASNQLDNPNIGGVVVVARDITKRKKREQELEEARELTEALTTTFPDYTFIYNEDGEYLDVITGWGDGPTLYTREEIIGQDLEDLLSDDTAKQIRSAIRRTLETGELQTIEYSLQTPGGTYWYEANLAPLEAGYDGERAVVFSARDITERRKREVELQRQNERLEEFASVVSHDLRNPLSVAEGRLQMAIEKSDWEALGAVSDAHNRMETLIDDMLSLANAGEALGELNAVQLSEIADACWGIVETESATLQIETEATIQADETRLQQLFDNLLRNAVEHGGEGVTITVADLPNGFYVEDDGPGIPPDEREEVLNPGYTTREAGTGFGLSIVRDIAVAHGWQIAITEGSVGGARFEITGVEVIGD